MQTVAFALWVWFVIEVSTSDGLCTIALNRPEKANALTGEMLGQIADAVEAASVDLSVRALVLTGRGKVFSAGADLEAARAGLAVDPVWERMSGAIAACPVLTIAALNGTAAGGSLGMVLAADLRVAVPGASLFYPVAKLGFLPQPSDVVRLTALVGPARAKMLLVAGERIGAEDAWQMGLVDRVAVDAVAEGSAPARRSLMTFHAIDSTS